MKADKGIMKAGSLMGDPELVWAGVIKELIAKRPGVGTKDIASIYCDIIEKRNLN